MSIVPALLHAMKPCLSVAVFTIAFCFSQVWANDLWVVVPSSIAKASINKAEVKKVFMGRKAAIDGVFLKPINFKRPSLEREAFLNSVIELNDDDYVAYWYVRRFSGQGVAPSEVSSFSDLTQRLLGADNIIGYLVLQGDPKPSVPAGYTLQKLSQ